MALPEDMSFSQSCQIQIESQIKLILEEIYKNKIFKYAEKQFLKIAFRLKDENLCLMEGRLFLDISNNYPFLANF